MQRKTPKHENKDKNKTHKQNPKGTLSISMFFEFAILFLCCLASNVSTGHISVISYWLCGRSLSNCLQFILIIIEPPSSLPTHPPPHMHTHTPPHTHTLTSLPSHVFYWFSSTRVTIQPRCARYYELNVKLSRFLGSVHAFHHAAVTTHDNCQVMPWKTFTN